MFSISSFLFPPLAELGARMEFAGVYREVSRIRFKCCQLQEGWLCQPPLRASHKAFVYYVELML